MNIFVLDTDPQKAAQAHCDKHVVKMLLETAQILSTALTQADWISPRLIKPKDLYKPTHPNHPATLWASECNGNFRWLTFLGWHLCREYTRRYKKVHKSQALIDRIYDFVRYSGSLFYVDMPMTSFVQCIPDEYKNECPVTAYREYYNKEKAHFCKWTARRQPEWFVPC